MPAFTAAAIVLSQPSSPVSGRRHRVRTPLDSSYFSAAQCLPCRSIHHRCRAVRCHCRTPPHALASPSRRRDQRRCARTSRRPTLACHSRPPAASTAHRCVTIACRSPLAPPASHRAPTAVALIHHRRPHSPTRSVTLRARRDCHHAPPHSRRPAARVRRRAVEPDC